MFICVYRMGISHNVVKLLSLVYMYKSRQLQGPSSETHSCTYKWCKPTGDYSYIVFYCLFIVAATICCTNTYGNIWIMELFSVEIAFCIYTI